MSNINGPVGPIVLTKMVLHKHKWSGSRNGEGQLYIELKLRHKLYASCDTQKYSFLIMETTQNSQRDADKSPLVVVV